MKQKSKKQNKNFSNTYFQFNNPKLQKNKIEKIHIVQGVETYRQSLKPKLDLFNVKRLEDKLALDHEAIQKFKERDTIGHYFLDYNMNPFLTMKPLQRQYLIRRIHESKKKIIQIVNLMQPDKNFEPRIKTQVTDNSDKLGFIKKSFEMQSQKTLNQIQKAQFNRVAKRNQTNDKKQQKNNKQEDQLLYFIQDDNLSNLQIQQIALVRQKNHFNKPKNKLNIFKLIKDDQCVSIYDHLVNKNFCWNSMIDKEFKLKIPIFRDLSTMARKITTFSHTGKQRIIDYIYPSQLTFSIKQVNFPDVINVASNRISSEFLYSKIYQDGKYAQDGQDEESQKRDKAIIYRKNHRNVQQEFLGVDQQIQQIQQYKMRPDTLQQKKQRQKYIKYKEEINQQLKKGVDLCLTNVFDEQIHNELDVKSSSNINHILKNKKKIEKNQSLQKTVRMKKINCNKNQIIRLKQFKEILSSKNKFAGIKTNIARGKFSQTLQLSQTLRR